MAAKRKQRKRPEWRPIYGIARTLGANHPDETTIHEMADGEIYIIGMITVLWAHLEHMLLLHTAKLANRAKFKELPDDATRTSFSRRLAAWREVIMRASKGGKERDRLIRLHSRIANLESDRHKVIHGLWNWTERNPDKLMAYSFRPGVAFTDPHFSWKRLCNIANRISAATYELENETSRLSDERYRRERHDAIKADDFAYWSRRGLLMMTGRRHAFLVPLGETSPELPLPQSPSRESPPTESHRERDTSHS